MTVKCASISEHFELHFQLRNKKNGAFVGQPAIANTGATPCGKQMIVVGRKESKNCTLCGYADAR